MARVGRPPNKNKEPRRSFYIRAGITDHDEIKRLFEALRFTGESFNEFGLEALKNELERRAREAKKIKRS